MSELLNANALVRHGRCGRIACISHRGVLMAEPAFPWFRALVLQTHRRGQQNVDIVQPAPLPADVLAHLNITLTVPTEADTTRHEFCFRFPHGTGMLYAFVAVRWYPDPAARGEHLQQSVVLVTEWPFIVLFTQIVRNISTAIFGIFPTDGIESVFSSAVSEMSAWPAPSSRAAMQEPPLALKVLGQPLEPVPLAFTESHIPGQLVYQLPISSALRACVPHLSCLWELVLLAHPVVVIAPDAATAARGVLATISVISPLSYAGDFRPFLDVNNPAAIASLNTKRPCVVGVVGSDSLARLPVPHNGEWHVLWLTPPPGLSSSYSPALPSEAAPSSGFDESSDALLLRSHLIRMVAEFCGPLDTFASIQLAAAQRATTAFRIAPPPLFDGNAALEWLEQTHLPRAHPLAAKRLQLYRRFFASPNFGLWRLNKQIEDAPALVTAQLAAIRNLPAQVAKLGELELVDVIIRANEAARAAGEGPVCAALEAEASRMRASLPIDLQQSLPAALLGTYSPTPPPTLSTSEKRLSASAKSASTSASSATPPPSTSTVPVLSQSQSPSVTREAAQDATQQSLYDSIPPRPPSMAMVAPLASGSRSDSDVTAEKPPAAAPPALAVVSPLQALSKEQLRQVTSQFNSKPEAALNALTTAGHWKGEPGEIAAFLWTNTNLSPAKVGEYLSEPKPTSALALKAYSALFQFSGKSFGDALREFLSRFRLPGEAQKIDRIMEAFAGRFHACNPQAFPSADTAYVLAFSTIMLNTDAHNPQVKKKMTKREFVSNNRGIADGKDLPVAFLEGLYDSIVKTAIQLNADGLFSQAEKKGWLLKQGANSVGSWQKRWFVLASNCLYYFTKPEDKDPRVIIPLEGLAVRTTNEWPGHPCFEIYEPRGGKIKSVKLGAPGGSSEGQHDKFVFEAESTADLEGWMQGIQAHVVNSPGLQLLLDKKKEISTRTTSPRGSVGASAKLPAGALEASDRKLSLSAAVPMHAAATPAPMSAAIAQPAPPSVAPVTAPAPVTEVGVAAPAQPASESQVAQQATASEQSANK